MPPAPLMFAAPPAPAPPAPPEQTPLLQTPLPQDLPHAPQLVALEAKFSHAAPHSVRPCAHVAEQAPNEHTSPFVQTVPHVPQFWGSDCTLLQAPPQLRWSAEQESLSFPPSGVVVEHALVPTKVATSRLAKIPSEDTKRVMLFPVGLETLAQARPTVPHFLLFSPTPPIGARLSSGRGPTGRRDRVFH